MTVMWVGGDCGVYWVPLDELNSPGLPGGSTHTRPSPAGNGVYRFRIPAGNGVHSILTISLLATRRPFYSPSILYSPHFALPRFALPHFSLPRFTLPRSSMSFIFVP